MSGRLRGGAFAALVFAALGLSSACGAGASTAAGSGAVVSTPPPGLEAVVFSASSGAPMSWAEVVERALEAQVIHVGENHASGLHHALQGALILALAEHGPVVVALEMLPWTAYAPARALSDGTIDPATFVQQTGWAERWGFDAELYGPVLETAAHPRVRIVPMNAPDGLSREVARGGWASLGADARRTVPARLSAPSRPYRAWLETVLQGHGHAMPPDAIDRFVEAQTLWDGTMAANTVAMVESFADGTRVVVVAGGGHIRHGWGIPARVAAWSPARQLTLLCDDAGEAEAEEPVADVLCTTAAE